MLGVSLVGMSPCQWRQVTSLAVPGSVERRRACAPASGVGGNTGAFWTLFYVSRNAVLGTLFWVKRETIIWAYGVYDTVRVCRDVECIDLQNWPSDSYSS